jgi:hypothetical protein
MNHHIDFDTIKNEYDIIFLNDDAKEITVQEFEEDLKTGYRAGIVIVFVKGSPQVKMAMMTPYHKDQFEIDPRFLSEKYQEFYHNKGTLQMIIKDPEAFLLCEVLYGDH